MECVILFRNPISGVVGMIHDGKPGEPLAFKNLDEAVAFSLEHRLLQAWPHQIVELDEL